jgi:hypothetical protein
MTGPAAGTPPRHVRTNSNMSLGRLNLDELQEEEHSDVVLPVLQALIRRLEEMKAVPTMDLFRAPGSFSELEVMHQQLVAVTALVEKEKGGGGDEGLDPLNVLRSSDDVHTIAALLLRWVRESRGPLLPPRVYSQCAALMRSSFVDGHEAAMAVRMFVAEQSDSIAKPLLMLTDFLRSSGQQHLQQLAELFVPALFRPVGAMGGVEHAMEFTARLMGKVDPASGALKLEEAPDDVPPDMPAADESQSVATDDSPPPMVSPSVASPTVADTESAVQPTHKRRRGGMLACCGSRNKNQGADGPAHKKGKRKSAPGKLQSTGVPPTHVPPHHRSALSPPSTPTSDGEAGRSQTRRHPSKPHALRGLEDTPQPKQTAANVKRVVFGTDRPLGLVLGSNDPLDRLWLELDSDRDGQLGPGEVARLLAGLGRPAEQDDVAAAMVQLDMTGSGSIGIAEFEDWYVQQPERSVGATAAVKAPVFIQEIGAYAAKRGLRPGMRILSLQGSDTRHLSLREVSELLAAAGRPLSMEFAPPAGAQAAIAGGA